MAGSPIDETQVQRMLDAQLGALQTSMSASLREEFATSAATAAAQVTDLQTRMSTDLREEFNKTSSDFQKRLDFFGSSMDSVISGKFEEADARFGTEREAQVARFEEMKQAVVDMQASWVRIQEGAGTSLQDLSEALQKKEEADLARLTTVVGTLVAPNVQPVAGSACRFRVKELP